MSSSSKKRSLREWISSIVGTTFVVVLQGLIVLVIVVSLTSGFIWLSTKPVATYMQIDLVVDRITFRVNSNESITFLPIKFEAAKVSRFASIEFYPEEITTLENTPVEIRQLPVVLESKGEEYLSSISILSSTSTSGSLHNLSIEQGFNITLEVTTSGIKKKEFVMNIENNLSGIPTKSPQASLRHREPFRLKTQQTINTGGIAIPTSFNVIELSKRAPSFNALKVVGQPNALKLLLTVPSAESFDIFPNDIAVTALNFVWEDLVGGQRTRKTSLIKEGEISYPDYPQFHQSFDRSHFLSLGENDFNIEKLYLTPENNGIAIRLRGLAEEPITTYLPDTPEKRRDYRLTIAEMLPEKNKFWKLMFGTLSWLVPTLIGLMGVITFNKKILK